MTKATVTWAPYGNTNVSREWLISDDGKAFVRAKPMPNGRFMWNVEKTVGDAPTVEKAKEQALAYLAQCALLDAYVSARKRQIRGK